MISNFLDRIGNWNPQLARELKGRLKPRGIILVSGISLLGQFSLIMMFWANLPVTAPQAYEVMASDLPALPLFLGSFPAYALMENDEWQGVDWLWWWGDIFHAMNQILLNVLVIIGVYLLIRDLTIEYQRGTLNFIRLTPQSSQQILIGKLLGVPILLYLAIVLALPLQLWAAVRGAIPVGYCIGFYAVAGALSLGFYTLALLLPLGMTQAWLGSLLVSILGIPLFQLSHALMESTLKFKKGWQWFGLSPNTVWITASLCCISSVIATYWIWQAANRRFCHPRPWWIP